MISITMFKKDMWLLFLVTMNTLYDYSDESDTTIVTGTFSGTYTPPRKLLVDYKVGAVNVSFSGNRFTSSSSQQVKQN